MQCSAGHLRCYTCVIDGPTTLDPFLRLIDSFVQGGAFHRNAGHVLQVRLKRPSPPRALPLSLAFQEYHSNYTHKRFTMGFAGRPGGPEFYISTIDNTHNHGPGPRTHVADTCFGRIIGGSERPLRLQEGTEVVKRMQSQPGGKAPNGFIADSNLHIAIEGLRIIL